MSEANQVPPELPAGSNPHRVVTLLNLRRRAHWPMSLFSSDRERRLWLWTLAVVVAIYSTLGLIPELAGALRDTGLAAAVFFLCMLLIAATIVTQGLQVRPRGAELAVGLGVIAVYLLVTLRIIATSPAERTHLMEYGVMAVFMYEALRERASQGRRVPVPALLAILATFAVGVLDECIQWVLPNRVFDPIDILFNVLAAFMSVAASVVLGWARRLAMSLRT